MWEFFWNLLLAFLQAACTESAKELVKRSFEKKAKEKSTSASRKRHRGRKSTK